VTEPMTAPARAGASPIDESGFVEIGGIEQWISIRSHDVRKPVLLYLHGGPAEAQSPFIDQFAVWEREFVVVNWDQRGSGRTFGRHGASTPGMSSPTEALDRITDDICDLSGWLRERFGTRVVLVGQSWGAVLGLRAIHREPADVAAFVGTGLPVSWRQSREAQERWARAEAERAGDIATVRELDATATLPLDDLRRITAGRGYLMSPSDLEYLEIQRRFLGEPPFSESGPVGDWIGGTNFTVSRLYPANFDFDLARLGHELAVPAFVIQGRDDHVVSNDAARDYVTRLDAPDTGYAEIPGGHFACFTHAAEFLAVLTAMR
jgi:pimeloyl-ACP methyl ester carboxylesterase